MPLERADPLALQIEHFAAVIRGEAEPLVTAATALQNLRVTDAIVEAARTGGVVETRPDPPSRKGKFRRGTAHAARRKQLRAYAAASGGRGRDGSAHASTA